MNTHVLRFSIGLRIVLAFCLLASYAAGVGFKATTYYSASNPTKLIVANFNGDQIPDYAIFHRQATATNPYNLISVYVGNGSGSFSLKASIKTKASIIAVGQFNGDKKRDIIGAVPGTTPTQAGGFVLFPGNGDGTFGSQIFTPNANTGIYFDPMQLLTGDLNRDGIDDLFSFGGGDIAGGPNGTFFGTNTGLLTTGPEDDRISFLHVLSDLTDMNLDGKLDLPEMYIDDLGIGGALSVYPGNGDGTFGNPSTVAVDCAYADGHCSPSPAVIADFNGDRKPDAAYLKTSFDGLGTYMVMALNDGTGHFRTPTLTGVSLPYVLFGAADLNGDGKADMFNWDWPGGVSSGIVYLINRGNGTFAAPVSITLPTGSHYAVSSDLNRDGATDLIVSTYESHQITYLLNNAGSRFTLTSSALRAQYGSTIALTATVTPTITPTVVPTGTVTLKEGTKTVAGPSSLVNGAVIFKPVLSVGTHLLKAYYSGNSRYNPRTASLTQVVIKAATSVSISSSVNPSVRGQAVTFTATVTPSTTGTPTGNVVFKNGTNTVATVALNSARQARYTTSSLAAGTHVIRAVYQGNGKYAASKSPALPQIVR